MYKTKLSFKLGSSDQYLQHEFITTPKLGLGDLSGILGLDAMQELGISIICNPGKRAEVWLGNTQLEILGDTESLKLFAISKTKRKKARNSAKFNNKNVVTVGSRVEVDTKNQVSEMYESQSERLDKNTVNNPCNLFNNDAKQVSTPINVESIIEISPNSSDDEPQTPRPPNDEIVHKLFAITDHETIIPQNSVFNLELSVTGSLPENSLVMIEPVKQFIENLPTESVSIVQDQRVFIKFLNI